MGISFGEILEKREIYSLFACFYCCIVGEKIDFIGVLQGDSVKSKVLSVFEQCFSADFDVFMVGLKCWFWLGFIRD